MAFPFVSLLLVSLSTALLTMPLARLIGVKVGLLDHPSERKLQQTAIPRTGGIGVLLGLIAGTALLGKLSSTLGVPLTREVLAILLGAVMIHITGTLDDLFDLPALGKLLLQTTAVGVVISQGVVLERIVLGEFVWELGVLSKGVTAFFLLGFINAINLADGLDGLASGIAAIAGLTLAILGLVEGNYVLAALATILLGAVAGFLPYNFLREKSFLGDAGSMLLGYMMGMTAITGAWFTGNSSPVFVVLACAAMPILDTATTILRRSRKKQKIFVPDSMHLHHRMVRFGLSPRRAVLVILAATLFCAGQTLVFFAEGMRLLVVTTSFAVVLIFLQIRYHRNGNLAETDASFREILFYLLGAQDGASPSMRGEISLGDVLAGFEQPAFGSAPTAAYEAAVSSRKNQPIALGDAALKAE